ncbi:MAG: cytochrome C [Betaproteobacteria bacterium]|nr:cytochrome C [Betaproteobacteria bacterium]
MKKLTKSDFFAAMALLLFLFCFTIPTVVFYQVPEKISRAGTQEVSSFVFPLWNFYQKGRYVSPYTPAGAAGDLRQLIERKAEIGMMSFPIWYVTLEAPNYPKEAFPEGIPVYFHLDGYSGDVHEMNTINHFIGMYSMETGAQTERALSPFILVVISLMMVLFFVFRQKWSSLLLVTPILFPLGFFGFYVGWLYWYGHNLQEWGMFKVKPFMPTALGDGKVAQFTTHSYPAIGFYILLLISVLCLLAVLSRKKESARASR